ncbi:hypothetical protein K1719_047076 [Acacia pycnantha]|nr:hypothetical protein K1719_047076 [Acacia pycnantha]
MSNNNIVPTVVLSDNNSMPVMGLGTGDMVTFGEVVKNAIIEGIKAGYRHFDTASSYGTEDALGDAIEEALKLGLIGSRDELFITSKLWFTDAHPDRVIPALKKSLGLLKLEYLDLYLIHMPISAKPGNSLFPPKEDITPLDLKGVWAAMEECRKLGLAKSIGVSNFPVRTLESLLSVATVPPCLNQVEMSATCQQKELREYCKQKVAQVALRWLYEQGVGFIARSFNKDRMKQNLEIFDWSLTQDDLEKISQIKQIRVHEDSYLFQYVA